MHTHTIIATRRTFDGKRVDLWSDGTVTAYMTSVIIARALPLDAGWLVMGEVCVYDVAELKKLCGAARKGVRQRWVPALDYLRNTMAGRRLRFSSNAMGSVGAIWWATPAA